MSWYRIKVQHGGGHMATTVHFIEVAGHKNHKQRLHDARDAWLEGRWWGHNSIVVSTTRASRPSRKWIGQQVRMFRNQVVYAMGQRDRFERLLKEL